MPWPSKLSQIEADAVMRHCGFLKSLIPTQDVRVYVNGSERIVIDFHNAWEVLADNVRMQLERAGVSLDTIESAYSQIYPD